MNQDSHLMFESYLNQAASKYSDPRPITNYAIKELERMHDKLNSLSTAIELAHEPEIDQLLSKIGDLSDMLISDSKHPENEEGPVKISHASADDIKNTPQSGPVKINWNAENEEYKKP